MTNEERNIASTLRVAANSRLADEYGASFRALWFGWEIEEIKRRLDAERHPAWAATDAKPVTSRMYFYGRRPSV